MVRTDFFPGLGWMLPRRVWDEVAAAWPQAYWDDWIREPLRRQGRQFIRPEVCRTYHFGRKVGGRGWCGLWMRRRGVGGGGLRGWAKSRVYSLEELLVVTLCGVVWWGVRMCNVRFCVFTSNLGALVALRLDVFLCPYAARAGLRTTSSVRTWTTSSSTTNP